MRRSRVNSLNLSGALTATVTLLGCGALIGCGGRGISAEEEGFGTAPGADAPAAVGTPAPTIENSRGVRFRRADLYSEAEQDQILADARSAEDGAPVTVEKLAAQLRGMMLADDTTYIEEEPPLEMARRVLAGEALQYTPGAGVVHGRYIWGYDDRRSYSGEQFVGFSEKGCTSTLIGTGTAVTAGHCVYNTGHIAGAEGWLCDNNAAGDPGIVSGDARAMSAIAPHCKTNPNRRYAAWRFGVAGLSGISPWLTPNNPLAAGGCLLITVPVAYVSDLVAADVADNTPKVARWDYAVVDLARCGTFRPTLHMSTLILSDSQLLAATVVHDGYPLRAGCGSGPGRRECSTPSQYLDASGSPTTTAPYAGATRWYAVGDDIGAGASPYAAHTIQVTDTTPANHSLDNSGGMSGGALYLAPWYFGAALCSNGPGCLIGTASGSTIQGVNYFHRWNAETYNFASAHAAFPDDN